jgi:hypothetical protein
MRRFHSRPVAASKRRLVAWSALLPAAGFGVLGACAAFEPPDITTSHAFQGVGRQALYERTVAALRASGLQIIATDPADGAVTAVGTFEDRDWAECPQPKMFVEDSENRHHLIAVPEKNRRVELQASVSDAPEGARLTLDPTFTAEPVSSSATTPACRTTGALERQIFAAVAKA